MAKNPGRDAWANGGKGKAMGAPRDMQVRAAKGLGPNKACLLYTSPSPRD